MVLSDLLPQDPALGPPLPRFLCIFWPWVREEQTETTAPVSLPVLFRGSSPAVDSTPTYQNLESIEFPDGFDPDTFMPRKIVVHRKYKQKVS